MHVCSWQRFTTSPPHQALSSPCGPLATSRYNDLPSLHSKSFYHLAASLHPTEFKFRREVLGLRSTLAA